MEYSTRNYIQPKYAGNLRPIFKSSPGIIDNSSPDLQARYTLPNRSNIRIPEFLSDKKLMPFIGVTPQDFAEREASPDAIITGEENKKYISKSALALYKLKSVSNMLYSSVRLQHSTLIEEAGFENDSVRYKMLGGALKSIKWQGRVFELSQEIYLSIRYDGHFWFHEHEELGIYAYGATVIDSLNDFHIQFDAAWVYYGKEDDDKLTSDAQDLKQKLITLVGRVIGDK